MLKVILHQTPFIIQVQTLQQTLAHKITAKKLKMDYIMEY